jgi:AAA15 family ATPase/GTPase
MAKYPLDNVEIQGFRGLKVLRLEELGLINILVGENNCGKTSVLEALSILCQAFNPLQWLTVARTRDAGGLDESVLYSLRWFFDQNNLFMNFEETFKGGCKMLVSGRFELRSLTVEYCESIYDLSQKEIDENDWFKSLGTSDLIKKGPWKGSQIIHHVVAEGNTNINTYQFQIWDFKIESDQFKDARRNISTVMLNAHAFQINPLLVSIVSRNSFDNSGNFIQKLIGTFDSEIRKINVASFRGFRPSVYVQHDRLGVAPLSIFGDGFRRVVLIANEMIKLKGGGVLLIDEIEAGIHVKALKKVFSWLVNVARELNVQVFVTTHSLEALDAILASSSDNLDDTAAYHLSPSTNETRVKRFSGELLNRIRGESGLDVR